MRTGAGDVGTARHGSGNGALGGGNGALGGCNGAYCRGNGTYGGCNRAFGRCSGAFGRGNGAVGRFNGALLRAGAAILAALLWTLAAAVVQGSNGWAQSGSVWEQWQHLPGVVDVGGPRSDGRLVVMAAGQLVLVSPDGSPTPFARGSDGFSGSPDAEPYLVVAPPGLPPTAAGCSFNADDVFILDLVSPPGIVRVDPAGHTSNLARLPNVDTLGGLAIDTVGRFGYRLLVAGSGQNREVLFAVDCQGGVSTITDAAPTIEGGMVVAPAGFGAFGGDFIGADENSGQIWAIAPDGSASLVLLSSLPTGGDTGVESLGVVPAGGGTAYLADRATANNPFPGTDSILRLGWPALSAAGVQAGDLLVATEGGGTAIAIRCTATCTALPVADGPAGGHTGHIEGRITVVPNP